MAGKPNYKFERSQRERAKAEKKAARLEAKRDKSKVPEEDTVELAQSDDSLPSE
jgi:hypothetical protein